MADELSKEEELFKQRVDKAERLRGLGVHPFGTGHAPKHLARDIIEKHASDTPEALEADKPVYSIAGRVVLLRSFGKAAFVDVRDRTGKLQVHVRKDLLGDATFEQFKLLDLGDFIAVEGPLFRSKTGELTLSATSYRPLTKALRAPPEKWHGITDTEQRYRQRYLDLLSNAEVRDVFVKRSRLVKQVRDFLDARGFLEVETPMMHPLVSGATARPFITHHNALDMQLFMRIAPELYLKRLVVGGFERVYEINRNFRNEGISTRHNPEFTMVEFYQAYATYEDLMALTEEMLFEVAVALTGGPKVRYGEHDIDFSPGFRRLSMHDAVREAVPGLRDSDMADPEALRRALLVTRRSDDHRREAEAMSHGELLGALFEEHVEATLTQPTFICQFPTAVSPLARRSDRDPEMTDRFELFVAGREIANAFSELNDPIDQKERFLAQVAQKSRGSQEAMDYDADYIRALEHGMPPTAGEGIGIDRLVMLLTNAQSIRDVILFPLMKPVER